MIFKDKKLKTNLKSFRGQIIKLLIKIGRASCRERV